MIARKLSACALVFLMTVSAFAFVSFGARADQGAQDSYGYYWVDSNTPDPTVTYNWIDITGTGTNTLLSGDDAVLGPFPVGFAFEFYGNSYSAFNVTTNGYIMFDNSYYSYSNTQIPDLVSPDNFIAPYWDDLYVDVGGAVYYQTFGFEPDPDQYLVIEYYAVNVQGYSSYYLTFEIILYETGEIWFQYNDLDGWSGEYASVGIEDSTGAAGCEYSYMSPSLSDGLAVMFDLGPIGLTPYSEELASWDATAMHTIHIRNAQAFTDVFDIVNSSLNGWDTLVVDGSMTPLGDSDSDGIFDTGDLLAGESMTLYVLVGVPAVPTVVSDTVSLRATSSVGPGVYADSVLVTETYAVQFATGHSDHGEDIDSDGDFDYLDVDLAVTAVAAASVGVIANLKNITGLMLTETTYQSVPAGTSYVTVSFWGEDIHSFGDDGPFYVDAELQELREYYMTVDHIYDYETQDYLLEDFDPPVAEFSPPHDCTPVDEDDTNTQYDYLLISASVMVYDSSAFRVYATLYDSGDVEIVYGMATTDLLEPGLQVVEIIIPSLSLNESGVDDYFVVELYLEEYPSGDYLDDDHFTTDVYSHDDFEGLRAEFVTPFSETVVDDDADGYIDSVVVTAYIDCLETGQYGLFVQVEDPVDSVFIEYELILDLTEGVTAEHDVVLDSERVYLRELSGDYDIYLVLVGIETEGWEFQDEEYYTTASYSYWAFEEFYAYISDATDEGVDTDADLLFNEVVITATVESTATGYFGLYAVVRDGYYYIITEVWEVVYLEEDVPFEWEVTVTNEEFLLNGYSTSLYVYFDVYDQTQEYWMSSYAHVSSYYYTSDFDPIGAYFLEPFSESTPDDDSDGLYDSVIIVIYVEAASAGYYDVEVSVYDPYYNPYTDLWFGLYLEEGEVADVTVVIPATAIFITGLYGSWNLEMGVYDHYTGHEYDFDWYYTDYYYLDDFEPSVVQFDPPHYDYGLDEDMDYLYDYLVVEVQLDCYAAGLYTVCADLYDYWGGYIASVEVERNMIYGNNVVNLYFDGWLLYRSSTTYYIEVDLWVEDSAGTVLDTDTHYSDYYYYYWDFETSPARFYPPHTDYAVDDDGDYLYEFLVVNASVEVVTAGEFVVYGELVDDLGYPVDTAMAQAYLEPGMHNLSLWFDAWLIALTVTDPDHVDMILMDADWNEMDYSTQYLSVAYPWHEFDETPPTIESGWAYTAPTVDGVVGADEWFGASAVDVVASDWMNEVGATMYLMNDGEVLYVLVDATGDETRSDGDLASVAFDTDNDEAVTDLREDQFALEATSGALQYTAHFVYDYASGEWFMDCGPFDALLPDHDGLAGAAGFGASPLSATSHRVYEFSIPLALLGAAPGDDIGFAGMSEFAPLVYDGDSGSDVYSTWPLYVYDPAPLEMYGDLVLSEERPFTAIAMSGDSGLEGWFVSEVGVTLTATGGTGGVDVTRYNIDGEGWLDYTAPFTVEGDGTHTLEYFSIDTAGNAEPVRTVEVNIDTVAPETTAADVEGAAGLEGWLVSVANVTFTVADDTSGLGAVMYRIDGGDWTSLSGLLLVVSEDGDHTLEYYAVDVAGNEEGVTTITVKVDTNAPVTIANVDGSMVILGSYDTDGSGVASTWYRIDDGDWVMYDGAFVVKGGGTHTVEYYSVDVAGNVEDTGEVSVQGDARILGIDLWIWAVIIAAVVVVLLVVMFLMKRKPKQPVQLVPGEAVAEPMTSEPPPPPP